MTAEQRVTLRFATPAFLGDAAPAPSCPRGWHARTGSGGGNPDDLNEVTGACERIEEDIARRFGDARIIANYTGGTKTMSVGLGLHALVSPLATFRGRQDAGDCRLSGREIERCRHA